MLKFLKIIGGYFRLSWLSSMEYRVNFLMWLLVDASWAVMDLIFFNTLVQNLGSLGHWTRGEVFIVVGMFRLLQVPIWGWMFQSFSRIPNMISKGELDMVLTKPFDSQYGVSFRNFSINMISSLVTGIFYIVMGYNIMHQVPSSLNIFYFVWLLIVSTGLIYGVYFLTISLSLFFDRLNNIHHLFPHFFDAARYPREIYPVPLQLIFLTIWPMVLIISVPAETLFGRPNWLLIAWLHVLAIIFFFIGRFVWTKGLRRYSSASS